MSGNSFIFQWASTHKVPLRRLQPFIQNTVSENVSQQETAACFLLASEPTLRPRDAVPASSGGWATASSQDATEPWN